MSCAALDQVAAYCLGELPEAEGERLEAHYFECDTCFGWVQAMQRFLAQLAVAVPTVLTAERRRGLEARHPRLPAVGVLPGGRARIRLGGDAPVGLWVMHAPLAGVTQVDVEARTADGGLVFAGDLDRMFRAYDAANGKVLWETRLNDVVSSYPISYSVDDKQYIAVVAGVAGPRIGNLNRYTTEIKIPGGGATLWVFEVPKP